MEEFIELSIKEKIEEIDSIEIEAYKKEFEEEGFLFANESFEDNETDRELYFELTKNKEEYVVFVVYSKTELEVSEHYVVDRALCTISK